jgi:hypothetical protein
MRLFLFSCGLALLSASACGGDERKPSPRPSTGGSSGSGAKGGSSNSGAANDGGTSGDAGGASEAGAGGESAAGGQAGGDGVGAPTVRITSPAAVTDPDDENALLGVNELTVACEVSGDYDLGSVRISLIHESVEPDEEVAVQRVGSTDVFEAIFFIGSLPNGEVGFRCSAEHSTDSELVGTDEIQTLVDHGPTITVIEPNVDMAYALPDPVRFEFTVEPGPLAAGDDGAEVDEVRLVAHGVEFGEADLEQPEPGRFVVSLDFSDKTIFPQAPIETVGFQIYATNSRSPTPVERRYMEDFVIDGEGPQIEILEPLSSAVIGGTTTLSFRITDLPAGVNEETVVVSLNGEEFYFGVDEGFGRITDVFSFEFNTTVLTTSQSQASVTIDAYDTVGNRSRDGATAIYYLDNVPPIVDLDPGWVREAPKSNDHCSQAFDPVGNSPHDGQIVQALTPPIRVLVWERTNQAGGEVKFFHAGVDPESVSLFLQVDPSKPLLVDLSGDGVCDAVDTSREADAEPQVLVPIPEEGRPWFDVPAMEPVGAPPLSGCTYDEGATEPDPLCELEDSDMTRIITQFIDTANVGNGNGETIYGIGSLETSCTGHQWEVGAIARARGREGWLCLGAKAVDAAGNFGFASPLRLCYDNPDIPGEPECMTGANPPSCHAGCDLPSDLEFSGGIIEVVY